MLNGLNKAIEVVDATMKEYPGTSVQCEALLKVKERLEAYMNEELNEMEVALTPKFLLERAKVGDEVLLAGEVYVVDKVHREPPARCPHCGELGGVQGTEDKWKCDLCGRGKE